MKNHHMKQPKRDYMLETSAKHTSSKISFRNAVFIGTAQIFALFAGISRSGITILGGLFSGLDYEDAARFSFLLATPIILAAGLLKLPDVFGHIADGARPQMIVGAIVAGISAYFTVRFLDKYFRSKTLKPFAIYCLAFGVFSLIIGLSRIRPF